MIGRHQIALRGILRPVARLLVALRGLAHINTTPATYYPELKRWSRIGARQQAYRVPARPITARIPLRQVTARMTTRPTNVRLAARMNWYRLPTAPRFKRDSRQRWWRVMTTAVLQKRTSETWTYYLRCLDMLGTGETISAVTGVTADQSGLSFGSATTNSGTITYSDGTTDSAKQTILVPISGGVDGQTYTVRATFTTSAGNTGEATVLLQVINQPT